MSARELKEVLQDILRRVERPRDPWMAELELGIVNFHPEPLEAHDLLDALIHFEDEEVEACAEKLKAALRKLDHKPDGVGVDECDSFHAHRARTEGMP